MKDSFKVDTEDCQNLLVGRLVLKACNRLPSKVDSEMIIGIIKMEFWDDGMMREWVTGIVESFAILIWF